MLYDGSCPFCSKEVAHYRKLDKSGSVDWVDISTDQTALDANGIALDSAMKHLHVIERDGTITKGAYAFASIWAELPYFRYLAKLVSLPGILPVLDKLYSRFARWRYARRKNCDTCQ